MARHVRTLMPAEAVSLLNELSYSSAGEGDSDGSFDQVAAPDDGSDEDALCVAESSDESDAEPPPPPASRLQLTQYQQTLQDAELQTQPPRDAGPCIRRAR